VTRVAFAAAHVAADDDSRIDWDATLAFRRHLWEHGLGVAEAMDTAQRGMGLDWPAAQELIRRTAAEAGGRLAAGAGTDHTEPRTVDAVRAAYEHQCELIEGTGAQVIVMASRALAAVAASPDDYRDVYGAVLRQLERPAILHWLGDMFDPALAGYWGSADFDEAAETLLAVVRDHAGKVDGIKVSLLDADREVELRQRLPEGVRMYTGDDFNYPELIASGSDALLGIFDAIAPAAAAALDALERGDDAEYDRILAPTVPLARKLFEPPTYHYKTGIVFLAWLNGHQEHFRLLGGLETARSPEHLAEVYELADRAGLLRDPDLAAARAGLVLA
jgi:dihydrodipicolinate synthase/N-acetylneuraminate lyase